MATSTCAECGSTALGIKELNPQDSKSKLVVQCRVCGAVVGVLNYTSAKLNELRQRLGYRPLE